MKWASNSGSSGGSGGISCIGSMRGRLMQDDTFDLSGGGKLLIDAR